MYKKILKRAMDVMGAMIILSIGLPILLLAAIAIKIEEPRGNILFKQDRPGKKACIFTIYKLRTMKVENKDSEGKELSDMQRITKVGKILRKFSIDELPQLINILKGDMSFIGPRPLLTEYLAYYSERQRKRHDVRPGMSGWAQVNGRNTISWEEKFELDVWYVEHISFKVDLKIFFATIAQVLNRKDINHSSEQTMTYFKG